jgi:metallo-beta-lactamase class B
MTASRLHACLVLAVLAAAPTPSPLGGQLPPEWASWNEPVGPFRIAGNLYYVGAREVAAYLFETPDGLILLDSGFEETVPVIAAAIETLGFRLEDVEILITSHAHFDHVGGLAELKRLTGATLVASTAEAPLLESGGVEYPFTPVAVDRVVEDGEVVELGGTRLTAMVTAGHTPGCTTWTATVPGTDLDALFLCSVSVLPDMDLVTPSETFPEGRAAAFRRSFERLEALEPDLFLGAHGSFFRLLDKVELLERGEGMGNPFVDPDLYDEHLAAKKKAFEEALARQTE